MHLSLVANPSHLEAVNTVVIGKVRAKQFYQAVRTDRPCYMLATSSAVLSAVNPRLSS